MGFPEIPTPGLVHNGGYCARGGRRCCSLGRGPTSIDPSWHWEVVAAWWMRKLRPLRTSSASRPWDSCTSRNCQPSSSGPVQRSYWTSIVVRSSDALEVQPFGQQLPERLAPTVRTRSRQTLRSRAQVHRPTYFHPGDSPAAESDTLLLLCNVFAVLLGEDRLLGNIYLVGRGEDQPAEVTVLPFRQQVNVAVDHFSEPCSVLPIRLATLQGFRPIHRRGSVTDIRCRIWLSGTGQLIIWAGFHLIRVYGVGTTITSSRQQDSRNSDSTEEFQR